MPEGQRLRCPKGANAGQHVNIAYVVHSGGFSAGLRAMLSSLDRHCDCKLIFVAHPLNNLLEKQVRGTFAGVIEFRAIDEAEWVGQRMARKIWELQQVSFDAGDKVFVLDTDLLIQADIFDAIDGSFDVALTSRHYDYW